MGDQSAPLLDAVLLEGLLGAIHTLRPSVVGGGDAVGVVSARGNSCVGGQFPPSSSARAHALPTVVYHNNLPVARHGSIIAWD